ncbi:MAG: DNA segregation ATPase FtsK/SpoIIIE-like protein [Patiriisocius sp.]|jgi:DNA segregation ATPase FtsK/SpoIIIE-like protein
MKKKLRKFGVEIVLGIGWILFLSDYLYGTDEAYILSVPLVVVGFIMLYRRYCIHHRDQYDSDVFFKAVIDQTDDDDLYEEAKEAVIVAGKASTSYLQRKLRVGYSRAARLMDMLEEQGVISHQDGTKPRQVIEDEID